MTGLIIDMPKRRELFVPSRKLYRPAVIGSRIPQFFRKDRLNDSLALAAWLLEHRPELIQNPSVYSDLGYYFGLGETYYTNGSVFSGSSVTSSSISVAANTLILVVVAAYNNAAASVTISSVTATGLTFANRASSGSTSIGTNPVEGGTDYICLAYFSAAAASSFSGTVTIHFSASLSGSFPEVAYFIFGVSGANLTTPFDGNVSLPKKATSTTQGATPTATGVSTTNPKTMLLGFVGMTPNVESGTGSYGSGYSSACTPPLGTDGQYKIVSAAQSSVSVAFGSSENNNDKGAGYVMYADAVVAAAAISGFFNLPTTMP